MLTRIYILLILTVAAVLLYFGIELSLEIDLKYQLEDPVNHCDNAYTFADSLRFYAAVRAGLFLLLALFVMVLSVKLLKKEKN